MAWLGEEQGYSFKVNAIIFKPFPVEVCLRPPTCLIYARGVVEQAFFCNRIYLIQLSIQAASRLVNFHHRKLTAAYKVTSCETTAPIGLSWLEGMFLKASLIALFTKKKLLWYLNKTFLLT